MTDAQFNRWKKNGNLQFDNLEIYESLSNDLSEGVKISPRNLLELAKYLALCRIELNSEKQLLKLDVLDFALNFQKK